MFHRVKITLSILLLTVAFFDILLCFGAAHGHGAAYTTKAGTCFGITLFDGGYRLFYATHREAGITGPECITYPWRSRIFNPFPTSSEFFGFASEDLTSDWSEYIHPFLRPGTPTVHIKALHIPHWPILCATLGIPFLLWFKTYRPRHRHRLDPTLCPTCSYDLRAHHPGDRCPECGKLVPAKPAIMPMDRSTP